MTFITKRLSYIIDCTWGLSTGVQKCHTVKLKISPKGNLILEDIPIIYLTMYKLWQQSFVFYCVIRAQRQSCLVIWYHSQTIWTVGGIVISHTTYDPIHLLSFVTLARSLIQMIGRSASENTEFCTSKMFINARKMKNSQIKFELMTINLCHLPTAHSAQSQHKEYFAVILL